MKARYALFFWIGIGIIIILNLLLWLYVNQVENRFYYELKLRLMAESRSLSRLVEEDYFARIIPGDKNSLEYISLLQIMDNVRRQDSLQSVILVSKQGKIKVASPEILTVQKQSGRLSNPNFRKALQGRFAVSDPVKIENNWFMSSFSPITDIDGFVTGVQVIETKAGYFETIIKLRGRLLLFTLINFMLIAIIAFFLYRTINRTIKYQAAIKDQEHLVQLGTMAATVAHEIRNPLGIIEGSNDLIKKKYGNNNDEVFNFIPSEVSRLSQLIENFLNFARTPKMDIDLISLQQLIKRIVTGINADSHKFHHSLPPDNIMMETDEHLLEQIILNILKNAFEASGPEGTVSLDVKQIKGKIQISIKDNGPGILKENAEKIFKPFFTTKEKGTGLGLATSYQIIKHLDGEIHFSSSGENGTEFVITIPLKMQGKRVK